jgi:alkaline phosphatase
MNDPTHDGWLPTNAGHPISRRDFLRAGAAALATGVLGRAAAGEANPPAESVRFGVFADPQYADREPAIGRHYRDSLPKLAQFAATMNREKPDFAIGLGDFIDGGDRAEADLECLRRIEAVYRRFEGPRHHVLGNHDVKRLTKKQFLAETGMPAAHYAFDSAPLRGVVLDADHDQRFVSCEARRFDWTKTYIPPEQQKWLAADLERTQAKTLVFVHQPLDDEEGPHGVKNAPDVRRILEASGKVLAVFQGHNHAGSYRRINGIHYFTMQGMVEGAGLSNNAYAVVTVSPEGHIRLQGYGRQPSRET